VGIGGVDDVKQFLTGGTDINVVNESGASLLHFAAFNGRMDMVDLLIDKGI
jgi:ankyrin repeat protein